MDTYSRRTFVKKATSVIGTLGLSCIAASGALQSKIALAEEGIADSPNTEFDQRIADAKVLLQGYCEKRTNEQGKNYTYSLSFPTEESLDKTANYVAEHGMDGLFEYIEENCVTPPIAAPQDVQTPTRYATVPHADGSYYVETGPCYGIAYFSRNCSAVYNAYLSYRAVVSGGVFSSVNSTSIFATDFNPPDASYEGGVVNSYTYTDSCGATGTFQIGYTWKDPILGFTVDFETDPEFLALITTFG